MVLPHLIFAFLWILARNLRHFRNLTNYTQIPLPTLQHPKITLRKIHIKSILSSASKANKCFLEKITFFSISFGYYYYNFWYILASRTFGGNFWRLAFIWLSFFRSTPLFRHCFRFFGYF